MKNKPYYSGLSLALGLGTLVLISLSMGIFALNEMDNLSRITEKMYRHPLAVSNAARDIRSDIIAMHRSMKDVALAQNDAQIEIAIRTVTSLEADVLYAFDIIEERFLGDKREVFLARRSFIEWKNIRDEVIGLQKGGMTIEAAMITKGKGADHVLHMNQNIQLMIEFATEKGEQFFAASSTRYKDIYVTMVVLLIAATTAGLVVAFFISKAWKEAEKKNKNQNWLSKGTEELNMTVQGTSDISLLSRDIVNFMTDYLGMMIGAIYICDNDDSALSIIAGYGVDMGRFENNDIPFGHGLVGQAAQSRKQILVSDIPEKNFSMYSGAGETAPRYLAGIPFIKDNVLIGVVEFGSLTPFLPHQLLFIHNCIPFIANAVTSCQARMQMSLLLDDSKLRTKQLEQQERSLILVNTSLEEKSKELKEQGEELRKTNEELETNTKLLVVEKANLNHQNILLEQTRKEVEKKAEEVTKASRFKSEFLANMSHELRTPLNSIILLSQHLATNKDKNMTEKQLECAATVHDSGTELLSLINEILDLSKVESGKMQLEISTCLVADILAAMNNNFKALAQQNGVEFIIDVAGNMPGGFQTDCQRVQQILKNILSNAFKFTSKGSVTLSISMSEAALPVTMRVTDTGKGIGEDKMETIFKAFQQEDGSTSREFGGTGLGLSISRELAALLGGTLTAESSLGEGAVFTLALPEKFTEQSEDETPKHETAAHKLEADISKDAKQKPYVVDDRRTMTKESKCILIIEDDKNFAEILRNTAREKGFMVLVAESGEIGLHMTDLYKPDGILLDMVLPGMDGKAVLFRLKDNLETRHIPVHVMSAFDKSSEPMHKGAVGFLSKPVNIESLNNAFARIENIIAQEVKKILVVEDDQVMQTAIKELLENGVVDVTTASSGESALAAVAGESFDCIILDLGLPDMAGEDLLKEFRKNSQFHIPIIVHTARDLSSSEREMLDSRADSVLVKDPGSMDKLLDECSMFLHRIATDLSVQKQEIIAHLHDSKAVFENKKVLIVDDDIRNVFSLVSILEDKGLETVIAENGEIALEQLQKHPDIDLILMDIMMPVMNGYEAMGAIRKLDSDLAKIGIIALTAKAMKGDRGKCIAAGASDYLSKPVDSKKLFSMLRVWLY